MVQRLDRPSRLSKECLFVGKMVHIAAADTASVGSRNASFQGSEQMSEVTARSGAPALPGPGWSHCVGVGGLVIAQGDHIFRWVPCVHFFFCALRQPLSWMWRHFSAGFGLNFWPCFFFGERWPKDERWLFGIFWPPFCSTHPPLTARSLGNWTSSTLPVRCVARLGHCVTLWGLGCNHHKPGIGGVYKWHPLGGMRRVKCTVLVLEARAVAAL